MNLNIFLRYTILGGLLLALFATPFIVSTGLFFPYIAGKGFFFRFVIEICLALWIILVARDGKYWPKKSQLMYAVLAFIVILALSTIFSVNTFRSFWSNFERMEGLVSYLHLFAYFVMLVSLMGAVDGETRKRDWHIVLYATVIASVCMAVYGLAQLGDKSLISSQSGPRVDGRFGNAAYMAVYMLLHIFLIVYLAIKRWKFDWLFWLLSGAAFLELVILGYTQTRGAFYGTIIGIILALVIIAIQKGGTWRKATIGGLVLLAVAWGGLYNIRDSNFVKSTDVLNRLLSVSLSNNTVKSRTTIWGMAVEGIQENPLLGSGLDNFNLVFNKYYKPALYEQEQWFDRAHNVFFDWLAAGGILGLLSYLALFFVALVVIWKRKAGIHEERAVLTGLLAAYFIHNFFVFDNLLSSVVFFTLLAYLTSFDSEHHAKMHVAPLAVSTKSDERSLTVRYAVATVAFFIMFPVIYVVTIKPYTAGATLIGAISTCAPDKIVGQQQPDGSVKNVCIEPREDAALRSLAEFNKVFDLNTFATTEAREQIFQISLQVGGQAAISEGTRQKFLMLAFEQLQKQVVETPNDARYRLFLGQFELAVGQFDAALVELTKAVELTPGKQSMRTALGQAYVAKGDMTNAIKVFDASYKLDMRNEEAGRLLFAAYLKAGKRTEAITVLQSMIQTIPDFKTKGEQYIADVKAGKNP